MQATARVLETKITHDGKFMAELQFNRKMPKVGELIKCKWGRVRSLKQNSIYWLLLSWYIEEGGMQDMGYMTKEDIHEAMKGRFLMKMETDKNGIKYYKECSTTELTVDEFMEYIDKVEKTIQEYCNISAAGFRQEYGRRNG